MARLAGRVRRRLQGGEAGIFLSARRYDDV